MFDQILLILLFFYIYTHKLNSRSAGLIQIADEMEYDQQIDDNPAILYDQALSAEGW